MYIFIIFKFKRTLKLLTENHQGSQSLRFSLVSFEFYSIRACGNSKSCSHFVCVCVSRVNVCARCRPKTQNALFISVKKLSEIQINIHFSLP